MSISKIKSTPFNNSKCYNISYLQCFVKFTELQKNVKLCLEHDVCYLLADKYLLAMTFTYFIRAEIPLAQYNQLNFFTALHIAHDMEEDDSLLKKNICNWATSTWEDEKGFYENRERLLQKMNFRASVSREVCDMIMNIEETKDCSLWKRERSETHSGAFRRKYIGQVKCRNCLNDNVNDRLRRYYMPYGDHSSQSTQYEIIEVSHCDSEIIYIDSQGSVLSNTLKIKTPIENKVTQNPKEKLKTKHSNFNTTSETSSKVEKNTKVSLEQNKLGRVKNNNEFNSNDDYFSPLFSESDPITWSIKKLLNDIEFYIDHLEEEQVLKIDSKNDNTDKLMNIDDACEVQNKAKPFDKESGNDNTIGTIQTETQNNVRTITKSEEVMEVINTDQAKLNKINLSEKGIGIHNSTKTEENVNHITKLEKIYESDQNKENLSENTMEINKTIETMQNDIKCNANFITQSQKVVKLDHVQEKMQNKTVSENVIGNNTGTQKDTENGTNFIANCHTCKIQQNKMPGNVNLTKKTEKVIPITNERRKFIDENLNLPQKDQSIKNDNGLTVPIENLVTNIINNKEIKNFRQLKQKHFFYRNTTKNNIKRFGHSKNKKIIKCANKRKINNVPLVLKGIKLELNGSTKQKCVTKNMTMKRLQNYKSKSGKFCQIRENPKGQFISSKINKRNSSNQTHSIELGTIKSRNKTENILRKQSSQRQVQVSINQAIEKSPGENLMGPIINNDKTVGMITNKNILVNQLKPLTINKKSISNDMSQKKSHVSQKKLHMNRDIENNISEFQIIGANSEKINTVNDQSISKGESVILSTNENSMEDKNISKNKITFHRRQSVQNITTDESKGDKSSKSQTTALSSNHLDCNMNTNESITLATPIGHKLAQIEGHVKSLKKNSKITDLNGNLNFIRTNLNVRKRVQIDQKFKINIPLSIEQVHVNDNLFPNFVEYVLKDNIEEKPSLKGVEEGRVVDYESQRKSTKFWKFTNDKEKKADECQNVRIFNSLNPSEHLNKIELQTNIESVFNDYSKNNDNERRGKTCSPKIMIPSTKITNSKSDQMDEHFSDTKNNQSNKGNSSERAHLIEEKIVEPIIVATFANAEVNDSIDIQKGRINDKTTKINSTVENIEKAIQKLSKQSNNQINNVSFDSSSPNLFIKNTKYVEQKPENENQENGIIRNAADMTETENCRIIEWVNFLKASFRDTSTESMQYTKNDQRELSIMDHETFNKQWNNLEKEVSKVLSHLNSTDTDIQINENEMGKSTKEPQMYSEVFQRRKINESLLVNNQNNAKLDFVLHQQEDKLLNQNMHDEMIPQITLKHNKNNSSEKNTFYYISHENSNHANLKSSNVGTNKNINDSSSLNNIKRNTEFVNTINEIKKDILQKENEILVLVKKIQTLEDKLTVKRKSIDKNVETPKRIKLEYDTVTSNNTDKNNNSQPDYDSDITIVEEKLVHSENVNEVLSDINKDFEEDIVIIKEKIVKQYNSQIMKHKTLKEALKKQRSEKRHSKVNQKKKVHVNIKKEVSEKNIHNTNQNQFQNDQFLQKQKRETYNMQSNDSTSKNLINLNDKRTSEQHKILNVNNIHKKIQDSKHSKTHRISFTVEENVKTKEKFLRLNIKFTKK